MTNVIWLKDLSKDDISTAGGKAASLGEMTKNGFRVPPGFVVSGEAYRQFIEESGIAKKIPLLLSNIDTDSSDSVQKYANEIQRMIVEKEMPRRLAEEISEYYGSLSTGKSTEDLLKKQEPFVAVRSSSVAEDSDKNSFAGLHATFLNVKGEAKLLRAVRACWASLFTARAVSYRLTHNMDHDDNIGVIVQMMIDSHVSGVMFTVNPVSQDREQMVIESTFGLGEALVSGSVTPDMFVVKKEPLELIESKINEKKIKYEREIDTGETEKVELSHKMAKSESLNVKQVMETARQGKRIEQSYKKPMDIEFAWHKDILYILQARPITTLKEAEPSEVKEEIAEPVPEMDLDKEDAPEQTPGQEIKPEEQDAVTMQAPKADDFKQCPDCYSQIPQNIAACPNCSRAFSDFEPMGAEESLAMAYMKASDVVHSCEAAITDIFKRKYEEIYKKKPLGQKDSLMESVGNYIDIPEDVKKVLELSDTYREHCELLSPEQVMFVLETTKQFVHG